jgi:hypothetical protein
MPHDFFLSYASIDDEEAVPAMAESKWITTFRELLSRRLKKLLTRDVDVFFDSENLRGNSALSLRLQNAVGDSHLFVAISSRAYYTRPWCRWERWRFIRPLRPHPAKAERVFIIHTTCVDSDIKPRSWQGQFFPDVRGYFFYRERQKTNFQLGAPHLGIKIADADSYFLELERLAQEMNRRIRELEDPPPPPPDPTPSPPGPAPTAIPSVSPAASGDAVFLAENAFRSHAEREEVFAALRAAHFEVRPAASLSAQGLDALDTALKDALAFVQLVSPTLIEIPGGGGKTYDQVQVETALSRGIPCFRWRAPDLDLAAGARNHRGYAEFAGAPDVRPQLLPQFVADLLPALAELRAKRRLRQSASADGGTVIIAGDAADLDSHAGTVAQKLKEQSLCSFISEFPASELTASDVRGYVVIYGKATAESVRDRLRLIRALPRNRQQELRVGIYFGSPSGAPTAKPLPFDMPDFHKIRWDDSVALAAFARAVSG